ncbi:MAG: hypothetical protein KZQ64_09060 [gamma proteobacterium symbiont of Bathyaustriella thionipta]|nr:hypothetical protein [gamma proteobacterium symbiont of Bathyaustriella thionipta]MCU7950738.1 hypothetical protein [gamma proteobacterium symbiont of Bathyaustriella thionipta]MCU7953523.1 hypothetical protein [gamma proteobacterium symbiont of Bathyaustriella thionipta]MCU7957374.1 hypothetical protein [gamma proteobacterium symbiont of Bathyaustriella thionipta]MCU7966718.1 hypothetical protein [gamma proteobacterium symbiont of Bathyaustriella thionipta]
MPNNEGTTKSHPISDNNLKKLQKECLRLNDDIRWLVALISDSGMRLSEAVGLMTDDICIEDSIPHIKFKPHSHRRQKIIKIKRFQSLKR